QRGYVMILEQNLTAVRPDMSGDQIDECGLAGPVRTDERQELPLLDSKVDTVAGIERSESLAQLDGTQQAHVTISPLAPPASRSVTIPRRCRSGAARPAPPERCRAAAANTRSMPRRKS